MGSQVAECQACCRRRLRRPSSYYQWISQTTLPQGVLQNMYWLFWVRGPRDAAKVNFEMLVTRPRLFLEGDVSRKSEMSDLPAGTRLNANPSVRSLRHPEH